MAVSDPGDKSIYVLDPDTPASAVSYPVVVGGNSTVATGLAITDGGVVYFAAPGTTGFDMLDTSTSQFQTLTVTQAGFSGVTDQFARVRLSPDGSRVYCNIGGILFWIDTSSNQAYFPSGITYLLSGAFPDFALSGDGSTVDNEGYFVGSDGSVENVTAYEDWETWFPTAATGQQLNSDGSILYQPLTDGIDLVARNTGRLLYRIQIPAAPASVYDALVVGPGGNMLAVITTAGVSLIDLSSLPISSQVSQPFPASRRPATAFPANRGARPAYQSAGREAILNARPHLKSAYLAPHQR
jgi:hypothetical protein